MRRSLPTAGLLLAVLLLPTPAPADPGPFRRFPGGGSARTDCALATDVAGATPGAGFVTARCTDGDPTCDADGVVDGTCVLTVRLCVDGAGSPRCAPPVVIHAELREPPAPLAALAVALAAMPMPVTGTETCTATVSVPVVRPAGGRGRVLLRAAATMESGHTDRDRLPIVCRAPRAPRTFATIERTVFATSCRSASCHGAARAGGLSLAGDPWAALVGMPPANGSARQAGLLRVAPGEPGRSFLLRKLTGTLGPGEGAAMPQVGTRLPAAKIDLVRRWIAAGAPAAAPF